MKRTRRNIGTIGNAPIHRPVQKMQKVVGREGTDQAVGYGEQVRPYTQGKQFGAFNLGDAAKSTILPKRIKYTLDNSGDTVNTKDFVIFDPIGLVSSIKSWSRTAAVPSALTATIVNDYFQKGLVVFDGIRAEVTSNSTQFQYELTYVVGDLDGKIKAEIPLYLEDGVGPEQYNNKIQNYKSKIAIDALRALAWTVAAGEKAYLTFYFHADFTRF